jgi:heme-degrading monooxygenase HmoA
MPGVIARLWRGVTGSDADSAAYLRHLERNVLPQLALIAGYRELKVLMRGHEVMVITFWESMEAVRRFAGDDPERAVVEPEARAVLAEFDDFVRHYEVSL